MSIFSYTSTQGITKNTPGPRAPPVSSRPSRKMTALSYSWELNMIPVRGNLSYSPPQKIPIWNGLLCSVVYHWMWFWKVEAKVRESGMLIWPAPPWPRRQGRGGAWRWWGRGRRRWGPWRTPPGPPRTLHTRVTGHSLDTGHPFSWLTEGVLAVTIVVVRLQRRPASHRCLSFLYPLSSA